VITFTDTPAAAEPAATHADVEHETVSTVPEPVGIDVGSHWDPPSLVTTS
jgi:hypothetical protein